MASKRLNVKAILADAELRRKLMVSTIQATQAREGIDTSMEQADRAYYIVTEAERVTFFELEPFRGGKRGEQDKRHEMFVKALRDERDLMRQNVARSDFAKIPTAPLAYKRVNEVSRLFKELPLFEPHWGIVRQGLITGDDEPFYRLHWEVTPRLATKRWVPLNKGGAFQRFYFDTDLVVDWSDISKAKYHRLRQEDLYFREGITWPYRSQRGFCPRLLDGRGVHSHVGHSAFPKRLDDTWYLLAVFSSDVFEWVLETFSAFGKYEIGMIKSMPVPESDTKQRRFLSDLARCIHDTKAKWDEGNEISTRFRKPWLCMSERASMSAMLDHVQENEKRFDAEIQQQYSSLSAVVRRLYGISDAAKLWSVDELKKRAPEVVWPQTEGWTIDQKRMEYLWRLLSFAVKRVVEADDDGIVPFSQATAEARLVDRVRQELVGFFPGRDESQLEVEIVNELKRSVKGYRKCASLDDWLANAFFDYHVRLYKSRPIFWHIVSTPGTAPFAFGALVHYHRFDNNRMAKLRASYVRDTIEELRREAGLADKAGRAEDRVELQAKVEEVQALDKNLQLIQEGHHEGPHGDTRDFRILTPWKKRDARPKGWTPDLDDGVKVNIAPLDRAGVLRVSGVAG